MVVMCVNDERHLLSHSECQLTRVPIVAKINYSEAGNRLYRVTP